MSPTNDDQTFSAQEAVNAKNTFDTPDMSTRIDWLRLNLIRGVGPRLREVLLEHFQTPQRILSAKKWELSAVHGIGEKTAREIVQSANRMEAIAELDRCREAGFDLVTLLESRFPQSLVEIPSPPGVLYIDGSITPADRIAIAIVGTRHASNYGLNQAEQLATGLAKAGYTIVSGLARGIDTAAHEAALAAGGRTIAVLGSGLLNIYPPENRALAEKIAAHGAVVSEYGLNHRPKASSFPQRNRIITGLALGVIVVEAAIRSGALISAFHAVEQNREVFAVPGRVNQRNSSGCHRLIREGAKLVENIDHVMEELGPLPEKTTDVRGYQVRFPSELNLNDQERSILDAIADTEISLDEVICLTGLPVHRVLATVSVLESKRLIIRVSGNRVRRA